MRVVHVSDRVTVGLNVVVWLAVQFASGYWAHRLPRRALAQDRGILRLRPFEDGGRLYERAGIRAWKDRLPDAGAVFDGGVSKRRIPSTAEGGLGVLALETRRAELAHWCAIAALPAFALFNPTRALPLHAAYAVIANAPCIAVQRYNRARVSRVLARGGHGSRAHVAARSRRSADTMGSNIPYGSPP